MEWPKEARGCTSGDMTKMIPRDIYGKGEQMREAEEWAAGLNWPKPVTYVEAGLCSDYMDNLIRSRWTEEDDRMAHEFWDPEFDDVSRMMDAAKAQGKTFCGCKGNEGVCSCKPGECGCQQGCGKSSI